MQANRGISVKPLAAALTIALAAAGANAHAGSNGNSQLAARMQALHGLVAQLKQYRVAYPGKFELFPHAPKHKIAFPRQRHAPVLAAPTAAVTSCVDDASSATTPGSLRYAVLNAADGDTIDLSTCNNSTITLTQGALPVAVDNLTITAGTGNHVTIDGGGMNQVIVNYGPRTTPPYVMALRYLTVRDGAVSGTGKYGIGGGCVFSSGGVALYQSTISGCSVTDPSGPAIGGGVAAYGLYMYKSTMTGNSVSAGTGTPPVTSGAPPIAIGGGAFAKYAYLIDSRIQGNTVTSDLGLGGLGGGFDASYAYLSGSTITGNSVHTVAGGGTTTTYAGVGGGALIKYGGTLQGGTVSGNTVNCSNTGATTVNTLCMGAGLVSGGGSTNQAPLNINYSTISGNSATCAGAYTGCLGGGVVSEYVTNLAQSTVTANSAQFGGGLVAKYVSAGDAANVFNSTIAANTAQLGGAGIMSLPGGTPAAPVPITLVSSIVAKNATAGVPDDVYVPSTYTLTIAGTNDLVMAASANITLPGGTLSADPLLGPLANNGGPTLTMGLLAGSPALGVGSNPNDYTYDQRGPGFPRTVGGLTDIGAFQGTVAAPAAKIPAPTLSTWGLGLLAALFGWLGWRRTRAIASRE
jgi:hypothetical protein